MPTDFLDSLEQLIAMLLRDGDPDIAVVAEAADMSKRTLQRRLSERGLSYRAIVKQTRLRHAAAYLADSTMPVSEIAASLGYTDASNFTRAFRCQTGVSPWVYRQSCHQVE
jgi:AraC-like DNA-binding protein